MGSQRTVVLSNAVLLGLLKRPDVIKIFPSWKGIAKQMSGAVKSCRCASRASRHTDKAINDLKQALSGAGPEQKQQFKRLLKADKVRLFTGKRMVEF